MRDLISPVTSQLLNEAGFRHAFFTRWGGVSTGPYAALNASNAVGDSSDSVTENLRRAAAWLGVDATRMFSARQVHGSNVVTINADSSSREIHAIEADALIAVDTNSACCVRTADCVPILIADIGQGRVAAVHAGWRGIVAGVILRAIEQLNRLGSKTEQLLAAIGPHIRTSAFEVSEQVARVIATASADDRAVCREYGARPHVALATAACAQLEQSGIRLANIDDVGGCTFTDEARFFSYRRQGAASGRLLHAIVAKH